MQLALEDSKLKKHQVFELNKDFEESSIDDLIVHIGLNTYTLKTTKTEKDLELEKKVELFKEKEFPSILEMFPTFGEVPTDAIEYDSLLENIRNELIKRITTSDILKDDYNTLENKDGFIHDALLAFAHYTAMIRGIKNFAADSDKRKLHKCFPLDYSERILNMMRKLLQDKYNSIDEFNKEFSIMFQDIDMDDRPKIGLLKLIVALEELTKFLAEAIHKGRKVELYEIKEVLHDKAELVFTVITKFKNDCIKEGKNTEYLNVDRFADYILRFQIVTKNCITALTDLDKRHNTSNMDSLELRHYIDSAIEQLYSDCDIVILRYTMDIRPDCSKAEDAYILAYYNSIYSTCEKKDDSENKYVNLYRHLLNLDMQQKTLFEKLNFPSVLEEFKKYVEHEYTNILHNNSSPSK